MNNKWFLRISLAACGLAFLLVFKTTNLILRKLGVALIAVLTLQISLGIANVVIVLPIPIAVSHNAIAAVLLLTLLFINYSLGCFSSESRSNKNDYR